MRDGNSNSGQGLVMPLVLTAGGGFAIWQLFKYLDKDRAEKSTKESQEKALGYTVSTQKTKERIAGIENNAWRTGINGYAKKVTVNVITEEKDAVRSMYTISEMKGITKYAPKSKSNIKAGDFVNAVFSVPLNALAVFSKVYTIYTSANVLDDASKLDNTNYAKIKTLFKVSRDKFPATWK